MHIFLTGDLRVGKSTLARKVLSQAQGSVGGFRTYFIESRENAGRALYMSAASDLDTAEDDHIVAQFAGGRPQAFPERFDALGSALLRDAREHAGLILMDECGRLERDALVFQREVLRTLDGTTPVLGVVRMDAGGWTHAIHDHPNTLVLRVTAENRDALVHPLTNWLNTSDAKELERYAYHD